jgi:hypothetical protein
MVVVEIRTPIYNEESSQIEWQPRTIVRADGSDLTFIGEQGVVSEDVAILDAATGRSLHGFDDPETWARNLPSAYRSGDLVAVVLVDTDPPGELAEIKPDHDLPTVPSSSQSSTERATTLSA